MQSLPVARRKRARRTRVTTIQSSSPRRQHEFRGPSILSPQAEAAISQEPVFNVDSRSEPLEDASDQPVPSLCDIDTSTDLNSTRRGSNYQSHSTRRQNEEENYQAFRPKALENFSKASSQQALADRYRGLADYTRDFTEKCTKVQPSERSLTHRWDIPAMYLTSSWACDIAASSMIPFWNPAQGDGENALTTGGKVQRLRNACKAFRRISCHSASVPGLSHLLCRAASASVSMRQVSHQAVQCCT